MRTRRVDPRTDRSIKQPHQGAQGGNAYSKLPAIENPEQRFLTIRQETARRCRCGLWFYLGHDCRSQTQVGCRERLKLAKRQELAEAEERESALRSRREQLVKGALNLRTKRAVRPPTAARDIPPVSAIHTRRSAPVV